MYTRAQEKNSEQNQGHINQGHIWWQILYLVNNIYPPNTMG